MSGASAAQIGAIHAISKLIGMTEEERRNLIAACAAGKRSSRELTAGEAIRVINRLKTVQGGQADTERPAKGARELTGKWAGKLRALWLSGWHLGVVRDRSDKALLAFLKRQTGLDHERFLHAAGDARRVIEALKGWLAREADVHWPEDGDAYFSKRAVHRAQTRRLIACGLRVPDEPAPPDMTAAELDAAIAKRGGALRKVLKKGASNGR